MTDYRIRRDRSSLGTGAVFNGRRRRNMLKPLLVVNLVALAAAALVWWQFPAAQQMALSVVGSAPTPTLNAIEYAERADRAYWRGDLDAAVLNYREAAVQRPDDIGILYELVRMLIYRSYDDPRNVVDLDEALTVAQQAVDAAPTNARAQVALCHAQVVLTLYEEAARTCLRAVDLNGQDAEAHAFLARAYEGALRYDESIIEAQQAVQLNAMSIDATMAYGDLLMTRRRYDQAKAAFEAAIQLHPRLAFPYFSMGGLNRVMAANLGQPELLEAAIQNYNAVLSMNRRSIKAYVRVCQTYMAMGEFNLARDNCTTATTLDPDSTEAWRFLGEVQYRNSSYDSAIAAFAECSRREQNIPANQRQWQCWAYQALSHVLMQRCTQAYPLLYDLLIWTETTRAIELANEGLDRCGGTAPPTPVPSDGAPEASEATPESDAAQG
jgi:tetratricopeptide (TPR) repeat protein